MAATCDRQEIALTVNADDLLDILRQSRGVEIEPFGDEHSLLTALVRTAHYDPLRHEVVLVVETTGVTPLPRGTVPRFVLVRRKELVA